MTSKLLIVGLATVAIAAGNVLAGDCGSKSHASKTAATPAGYTADAKPAQRSANLVETAQQAGSFSTLVAAVKAAGLTETLQGAGPYTVFAPTDAAFAKLPKGTIENLLKPENKEKLRAILTYHVVPGNIASGDVVKLSSSRTVQGQNVAIKVKNGAVQINDATVAQADVPASNGVIHVIDTVLLPPQM